MSLKETSSLLNADISLDGRDTTQLRNSLFLKHLLFLKGKDLFSKDAILKGAGLNLLVAERKEPRASLNMQAYCKEQVFSLDKTSSEERATPGW